MNNLVLQKLLHGYQLIKPEEVVFDEDTRVKLGLSEYLDLKDRGVLNSSFDTKWKDQFHFARHINEGTKKNPNGKYWCRNDLPLDDGSVKERLSICPKLLHQVMKSYSKTVTQAGKFYINEKSNNCITTEEVKSLVPEIQFYAPYRDTFLQVEDEYMIANIMVTDQHDESGVVLKDRTSNGKLIDVDSNTLLMTMNLWFKEPQIICLDPNIYEIAFSKGKYGFKVIDSKFSKMTDIETNDEENYTNEHLNEWVFKMVDYYFKFMVYLQFPQICDVQKKTGRKNDSWFDIPTKFTTSHLRKKPKFEHKELVINMFGDSYSSNANPLSDGNIGKTAFHSVRKHLRRLPNGKFTWVKAHFRGTKSAGIITKDYRLEE